MIVYFVLLSLSLLWLGFLFIGPYLLSFGSDNELFIKAYYLLYHIICHQKPERSYYVWNYQMPVCVRCFGIYLGVLVGLLIYPLFRKMQNTKIPKFKYLWIFLTPIVFDGLAQTINLYPSPDYVRLLTGMFASTGIIFYIMPLFMQLYERYRQ